MRGDEWHGREKSVERFARLRDGLERTYRWLRSRAGKPIPEVEIVNHCLGVSAYLSINIFYLYGGRPSLLMLPPAAIHFVDILIVSLSTM